MLSDIGQTAAPSSIDYGQIGHFTGTGNISVPQPVYPNAEFVVTNSGIGIITLVPYAAETFNGSANWPIPAGGSARVTCGPGLNWFINANVLPIGTVAGTAADGGALAAETTRAEGAEVLKAPLASPAFTGNPTVPTQSPLDGSTKIATTAYADLAVGVEATRAEAAEALKLALSGGTMSGAINMGIVNKIINLAFGSASGDAANVGQTRPARTFESFGIVGDGVYNTGTDQWSGTDNAAAFLTAIQWCVANGYDLVGTPGKSYCTSAPLSCVGQAQVVNMTVTSGSPTVTAAPGTFSETTLRTMQPITGWTVLDSAGYVPASTTVLSVSADGSTLTLSANATGNSSTDTLSFGLTTPVIGCSLIGTDSLGGSMPITSSFSGRVTIAALPSFPAGLFMADWMGAPLSFGANSMMTGCSIRGIFFSLAGVAGGAVRMGYTYWCGVEKCNAILPLSTGPVSTLATSSGWTTVGSYSQVNSIGSTGTYSFVGNSVNNFQNWCDRCVAANGGSGSTINGGDGFSFFNGPGAGMFCGSNLTVQGAAGSGYNIAARTTLIACRDGNSNVSFQLQGGPTLIGCSSRAPLTNTFQITQDATFPTAINGGQYEGNGVGAGALATQSCGLTNASPTITGTGFNATYNGVAVTGTGIPGGTFVLSVNSPTSITLTKNATITHAESLTFTPTEQQNAMVVLESNNSSLQPVRLSAGVHFIATGSTTSDFVYAITSGGTSHSTAFFDDAVFAGTPYNVNVNPGAGAALYFSGCTPTSFNNFGMYLVPTTQSTGYQMKVGDMVLTNGSAVSLTVPASPAAGSWIGADTSGGLGAVAFSDGVTYTPLYSNGVGVLRFYDGSGWITFESNPLAGLKTVFPLIGDVSAAGTVQKVQGVAVTAAEATLLSQSNNAIVRDTSTLPATALAGEETVLTGSTAGGTLTLPGSTAQVSSCNYVTNNSSVSVTIAAGSGTTINNNGTVGSITATAGAAYMLCLIGSVWYVFFATGTAAAGVASFNTRTGAVTLTEADVESVFAAKGGILLGTGAATGTELAIGSTGAALTVAGGTAAWKSNATALTSVASKTQASASTLMLGLAGSITPTRTGNVLVLIIGDIKAASATPTLTYQIAYGTGAAPSNGGMAAGTVVGSARKAITNGSTNAYTIVAGVIITGLTLGTAYWLDLQTTGSSSTSITVENVDVSAIES